MNLKLTNEVRSSVNLLHNAPVSSVKLMISPDRSETPWIFYRGQLKISADMVHLHHSSITLSLIPFLGFPTTQTEERQRTGRLIAVLVGICLLMLALYHAWVRKIPVVASLVVPALIMFVYVGWVLYTASRDKKRLLAAQAALNAVITDNPDDGRTSEMSQSNIEISVISSKESSKVNTPDGSTQKDWSEISSALRKGYRKTGERSVCFVKPIILINDKLPEDLDLDQKWSHIVEALAVNERLKVLQPRRKFKRKFCRSRRHAIFKRSYSIG